MTLEQRITCLEVQARRLRLCCTSLIAIIVTTFAGGAAFYQGAKVVQAERFELLGQDGRVRAEAHVDGGGGVAWRFIDLNGRVRTLVGVDRTADVIFYDRNGTRTFTVNEAGIAKN